MDESRSSNFIRAIIEEDLRTGRVREVVTRFPPEPNGYLHIGHAKAICADFGLAQEFGGRCHLRMDDTNPEVEDPEYVEAIQEDIRWLGYDWGEHRYNASDYFEQLYAWAQHLIRTGHAYVDEQSLDEIRAQRGTVSEPGQDSPWRDRPADESLLRLEEMRRGDHPDGAMVLRAKIDMAHPNMNMRDPVMYRIRNVPHHRTGDTWHVYPMYDWAHGQSDAIEGVTHSLCSLEFDVNRALYDWYLEHLPVEHRPRQYEWARFNLEYTVMSKRWLRALVQEGHVSGWDDPRMPTLVAYRRRGVRAQAIRAFMEAVGLSKAANLVEIQMLENAIRDDLNHVAPRVMVVLDPVELVLEDWEGGTEQLEASYWPRDVPKEGIRQVPLGGRVLVERDDFQVEPEPGYKRLAPGRAVRLRYGPVVTCTAYETDDDGLVTRVRARRATDDEKVWATIHWVDAAHAATVEVRLYDHLFRVPEPGQSGDFRDDLNLDSLKVLTARAEPSLQFAEAGRHFQFERVGYFYVDPVDSKTGAPVFNRTVALKDSWVKKEAAPERRSQAQVQPSGPVERQLGELARQLVAAGLSESEAQALEGDGALYGFYRDALATHDNPKGVAGWVVTEVAREAKAGGLRFGPQAIGGLVALIDAGTITPAIAKQVFAELVASGGDPAAIVEARGLAPITDEGRLQALIDGVLAAHPDKVDAYKGGRHGLLGFFVGQVMQTTSGRADAQKVKGLLTASLS